MKTKILFVAGMALAASSAFAQETYENANLVENELNGTARYVGMGGAMAVSYTHLDVYKRQV